MNEGLRVYLKKKGLVLSESTVKRVSYATSEGKKPVKSVPSPNKNSETYAAVCCLKIMRIKTILKAKSPGISRILWSKPIFSPLKPATSTTKLLSKAFQAVNAMGTAAARR